MKESSSPDLSSVGISMPSAAVETLPSSPSPRHLHPLALHDYLPIKPLGYGATGVVFLALHLPSNQPFALKVFPSSDTTSLARSRTEERVLSRLHHPFLPSLHSGFDHAQHRFLALDFCSGGNLLSVLRALPERTFSAAAIRFYAAEVVLALEHLHENGIVYRDLKPENILLSCDGHIMLTDFDLSVTLPAKKPIRKRNPERKENVTSCIPVCGSRNGRIVGRDTAFQRRGSARSVQRSVSHRVMPTTEEDTSHPTHRSFSFVGTEEFLAPEIIQGTGHDFAVDWWAFGVLLYEMRYGRTPFRSTTSKETFKSILSKEVEFSGQWSPLQDLIGSLLVKDPTERLGYNEGAAEVKAHCFFDGIKWDGLHDVLRPPFIPDGSTTELGTYGDAVCDVREHLAQVDLARSERRAKKPDDGLQDSRH